MYNNPWTYNGKEIESFEKGVAGFVYIVHDLETNQKYIGRKYVKSTKKVKGATRRKTTESDWQSYYTSHIGIKSAAKENPNRFKREILHICKTRGETNFKEVHEQIVRQVLWDDEYLNENIQGKWLKTNIQKYPKP